MRDNVMEVARYALPYRCEAEAQRSAARQPSKSKQDCAPAPPSPSAERAEAHP